MARQLTNNTITHDFYDEFCMKNIFHPKSITKTPKQQQKHKKKKFKSMIAMWKRRRYEEEDENLKEKNLNSFLFISSKHGCEIVCLWHLLNCHNVLRVCYAHLEIDRFSMINFRTSTGHSLFQCMRSRTPKYRIPKYTHRQILIV